MASPQVRSVLPVASRAMENAVSAKPEGLNICVERPFLRQVKNSLPTRLVATISNCKANQSNLNHINKFMLNTMGKGRKPRCHSCLLDQHSNASKA